MLILTRHPHDTLWIGDDITVTVLNVHGNEVRLAIKAPREVDVHREEVYRRIQAEKDHHSPPAFPSVIVRRSRSPRRG